MASGVIKGSFSGTSQSNVYPQIEWSSTKNIAANSSSVTAILYFVKVNSGWYPWNAYGVSTTISINGSGGTATRTFDLRNQSKQEIWRRTVTVKHDDNGSKKINIGASGQTGLNLGSYNFSGVATLDTIPRAYDTSHITMTNHTVDMGTNVLGVKVASNGSGFGLLHFWK